MERKLQMTYNQDHIPACMTIKEVAYELGVSAPTASKIAKREDFPAFSAGRRIIVVRDQFYEWVHTVWQKKGVN